MADKKKNKNESFSKKTPKPVNTEKTTGSDYSAPVPPAPSKSGNLLITVGLIAAVAAIAGILMFAKKETSVESQQETVAEQAGQAQTQSPQVPVASLTATQSQKAEVPAPPSQKQAEPEKNVTEEKTVKDTKTDQPAPATTAPVGTPSAPAALTAAQPGTAVPAVHAGMSAPMVPALRTDQLASRNVAAMPRATGVSTAATQQYKHVTAQDFTGVSQPSVPRQIAQALPRDLAREAHQQRIAEVPEELGIDSNTPIGFIAMPDGGSQFIVYNDNQAVSKVFTINKDGSKNIREIDENGRVSSETTGDTTVTYSYTDLDNGNTLVAVSDESGEVTQRRVYNDSGILVEETDLLEDEKFTYTYVFEGGQPVSFVKMDARGAEVLSGSVGDISELRMQSFSGQTAGAVKSYTYIRGELGSVETVVENKDTPDEVVRHFDRNGRLTGLEKKKTGVKYSFQYGDDDSIIKITATEQDGTTREISPDDPDFSFLESETAQFDPIEFSKGIIDHHNIMQYYNQNMLYKRANQATQLPNLPTADQITNTPGVPPSAPAVNLPPAGPGITTPAGASSAPARAPARAPASAPSVPRR
ncbi:MAG: hypothetical protein RBU23_03585 [Candidatus Auribacterota bacterium]|jgi:hypothetical protein|nr:hypothetical protein [Candidatus Auribacterota bacterium]